MDHGAPYVICASVGLMWMVHGVPQCAAARASKLLRIRRCEWLATCAVVLNQAVYGAGWAAGSFPAGALECGAAEMRARARLPPTAAAVEAADELSGTQLLLALQARGTELPPRSLPPPRTISH